MENTPDSVFCAHGAGYPVKWYKVPEFMHLDYAWHYYGAKQQRRQVLHDVDIDVEEDDAENLLNAMEKELLRRRFGRFLYHPLNFRFSRWKFFADIA